MTRMPVPGADAYAAMRDRAERAEQLAEALRGALATVLEAIGIPDARTADDAEVRAGILLARLIDAEMFLRGLGDQDAERITLSAQHLRDRLAANPATYATWDPVAGCVVGQDDAP